MKPSDLRSKWWVRFIKPVARPVVRLYYRLTAYCRRLECGFAWRLKKPHPQLHKMRLGRTYPDITCIIRSFNNGPYLKESIESLLGQTYAPKEIIIADDCSIDGSRDLIRSYEQSHISVRAIFRDRNLGASLNRHLGFLEASSPFVTSLDGDDVAHSRKLEREILALNGRQDAVVFSDFILIQPNGDPLFCSMKVFSKLSSKVERLKALLYRSMWLPRDMLYHKGLYLKAKGYDPPHALYDVDNIKLRLIRETDNWVYSGGVGLRYHRDRGGASIAPPAKQFYWRYNCIAKNGDWLVNILSPHNFLESFRTSLEMNIPFGQRELEQKQHLDWALARVQSSANPLDRLLPAIEALISIRDSVVSDDDCFDALEQFIIDLNADPI